MSDTSSIDVLLATLNATEVGSLDAIAAKMQQVAGGARVARARPSWRRRRRPRSRRCGRGDVAEWKRGRAFLQSKIGHLR